MESKAREISDSSNKPTTHNAIINGNFDVWQRGVSLGSGTGIRYLADRWRTSSIGTTYIPSRQVFVLGQPDVPNEPTFYHSLSIASIAGPGNLCVLEQRIEDVRVFAGEKVTLSFWAKSDGNKNMVSEFTQEFGTGGSPSPPVTTMGGTTHALTTNWQKFTTTLTIDSILGKTLEISNFLQLILWFDAGSNFDSRTNTLGQQSGTFDIAQVQIEKGAHSSDFERRTITQEIALCQRYYEKSYTIDATPGSMVGGTHVNLRSTSVGINWGGVRRDDLFSVEKRVTPTFVVYASHSGLAGFVSAVIGAGLPFNSTAFLSSAGPKGWVVWNNGALPSDGDYFFYEWTADAEL